MSFTLFSPKSNFCIKMDNGGGSGIAFLVVLYLVLRSSYPTEAGPTNNLHRLQGGGGLTEDGVFELGKLLAGGSGNHRAENRPESRHTTIWDLLVEKAEGYMHSMLFCTLSRPDLRDGVSGIKACEQSPLSLAIVENLITLMNVPNATPEKRDDALNKIIQACNSLEQIESQTCELENFKRVQNCFNQQQILEQYFKMAGLESLCGISGNQTDLNGIFKNFWNNGGKECMSPKSFDRLSQDSILCFELIKTHPDWKLKEMSTCIADQFKKCGGTGARDAMMPLLEGVLRVYHDIHS